MHRLTGPAAINKSCLHSNHSKATIDHDKLFEGQRYAVVLTSGTLALFPTAEQDRPPHDQQQSSSSSAGRSNRSNVGRRAFGSHHQRGAVGVPFQKRVICKKKDCFKSGQKLFDPNVDLSIPALLIIRLLGSEFRYYSRRKSNND
jgi:hypothetical protein